MVYGKSQWSGLYTIGCFMRFKWRSGGINSSVHVGKFHLAPIHFRRVNGLRFNVISCWCAQNHYPSMSTRIRLHRSFYVPAALTGHSWPWRWVPLELPLFSRSGTAVVVMSLNLRWEFAASKGKDELWSSPLSQYVCMSRASVLRLMKIK